MKTIYDDINKAFFNTPADNQEKFINKIINRSFQMFYTQYPDDLIVRRYQRMFEVKDKGKMYTYKDELHILSMAYLNNVHKIQAFGYSTAYTASYAIGTLFEIIECILNNKKDISRIIENHIFAECYCAVANHNFAKSTYIRQNGTEDILKELTGESN